MVYLFNIIMSFVLATGFLIFSFIGEKKGITYSGMSSLGGAIEEVYNSFYENALLLSFLLYVSFAFMVWILKRGLKEEDALEKQALAGKTEPLFTVLESFEVIKEKSSQGDPEYIYRLAKIHERGEGVPRDYKKALELYAEASDLGHGAASWEIAEYFDQGLIVPRNDEEKIRFIGIAAERNFPEAVKFVRAMTEPPRPSQTGGVLAAGIIGGLIGGAMAGD
jgi:TPR repeat protein